MVRSNIGPEKSLREGLPHILEPGAAFLSTGLSLACPLLLAGMNAAVRAVVRVGIFTGARVFFVHEVGSLLCSPSFVLFSPPPSPPSLCLPCLAVSSLSWLPIAASHPSPLSCPVVMVGPRVCRPGPCGACSVQRKKELSLPFPSPKKREKLERDACPGLSLRREEPVFLRLTPLGSPLSIPSPSLSTLLSV